MKDPTSRNPLTVLISTVVLAIGASVTLSLTVAASDASLKGAERLTKISATTAARPAASSLIKATRSSNCSPCQTVVVPQARVSTKAAEALAASGKPTRATAQHGCDGCSTRIETTGHGKAKTTTSVHECSRSTLASAQCCL